MELPRARALWTIAPAQVELREEKLAAPGAGQVLVQTLFSGISRGTESLVLGGEVPESEWSRMRAPFQQGEFPFPVEYGYSNVGVVLSGALPAGTRVFSLYPHRSHFVARAMDLCPIPDAVPSQRAVLAANMETALNALWDLAPLPGDRLTIVGAGALGCLVLSLASRYPALELEVVEPLSERGPLISSLGGKLVLAEEAAPGRDGVIHTSASSRGLQLALELCRAAGKVVELSWYGQRAVELTLGGAFHSQRLTLLSSQVGTVSPNKPGWSSRQRLELALRLLDDPRLDSLLAEPLEFEALPEQFAASLQRSSAAPALCVRYP